MPRKKSDFQLIIERLLIYPPDNTSPEAKRFWAKENKFFGKLFKKYPDYKFWHKISFKGSLISNKKLPSLVLFFDKDNDYWIDLLNDKWKQYNWTPREVKPFKSKGDVKEKVKHTRKKRSVRDFLT